MIPVRETIGTVETKGLVCAVAAADAMCKAAKVEIMDFKKVGSQLVAVVVKGDVAAVTASVEAGRETAERIGEVYSAVVIARPNDELEKLMR